MRIRRSPVITVGCAVLVCTALVGPAQAATPQARPVAAGTIVRISDSTPTGPVAVGNSEPSISSDGRYTAYDCGGFYASCPLIADDNNQAGDVLLFDAQTGTTSLISRTASGAPANGSSLLPRVSANGRYVVYQSFATDLPGGSPTFFDGLVYRYDIVTKKTILVSKTPSGALPLAGAGDTAISATGRYIAYESQAHNIVPGDHNSKADIFLYDAVSGTTTLVSRTLSGAQTDRPSTQPSISGNGRFVTYSTSSTAMGPVDTNFDPDTYIYDTQTGQTALVTHKLDGTAAGGDFAAISGNGQFVAFESQSSALVADDANVLSDVFLYNVRTGRVSLVSTPDPAWTQGGTSRAPSISTNGRFVSYDSQAWLPPAGEAPYNNIYLYDRTTGATTKVSATRTGGEGNSDSLTSAISGDGNHIVFDSLATNLVPGPDPSDSMDVFLLSRAG
jgi:hypothetical protein